MDIKNLKLGTRLEFEILDKNGIKIGNTYISQVIEPVYGNTLIISAPICESRLIYVPIGCKARITFLHSRYGLLGFIAKIISREKKENLSVLCIEAETTLEKIQRRTYYRLNCTLSAEYRINGADETAGETELSQFKKALTRNISGSGILMVAGEQIEKNTVLDIRISLSISEKISVKARVLRCKPLDPGKLRRYELALNIIDISPASRDVIIKYIFEQQRKLLKKDANL